MKNKFLSTSIFCLIGILLIEIGCKKTNPDTTKPVITINGRQKCFLQKGRPYFDDNATAIDNEDGTVAVTSAGTVNPSVIGTYTIIYTAIDMEGNKATADRIVYVVDIEGIYDVMNITPYPATMTGDTTYFTDNIYLSSDLGGQLIFSKFGGYNSASPYSYLTSYTNIFVTTSVINCGAPAIDRTFSAWNCSINNAYAPHTKLTINYKEVSDTTLVSKAIYTKQ